NLWVLCSNRPTVRRPRDQLDFDRFRRRGQLHALGEREARGEVAVFARESLVSGRQGDHADDADVAGPDPLDDLRAALDADRLREYDGVVTDLDVVLVEDVEAGFDLDRDGRERRFLQVVLELEVDLGHVRVQPGRRLADP